MCIYTCMSEHIFPVTNLSLNKEYLTVDNSKCIPLIRQWTQFKMETYESKLNNFLMSCFRNIPRKKSMSQVSVNTRSVLSFLLQHNTIIVTIVKVFCSTDLNVCGDRDALVLKGYHNNGRVYLGPALIANESLFVQGI